MSWIDQRPDEMAGAFAAVGPETVRTRRAEALPRGDEPARRRRARHHHRRARGGKTGFTATAVCSVSDAPPTLLVCLNRRSQTNPAVVENGVFCVNTLGAGGAEIADIFAGRTGVQGSDRFATGEWATLVDRLAGARDAVVAFDCRVIEVKAVACHNVFFGVVEAVQRRRRPARRWSITTAPTSTCECACDEFRPRIVLPRSARAMVGTTSMTAAWNIPCGADAAIGLPCVGRSRGAKIRRTRTRASQQQQKSPVSSRAVARSRAAAAEAGSSGQKAVTRVASRVAPTAARRAAARSQSLT